MKQYIEERAIGIANYIIEQNATVRQTAKAFGVSKSTVHAVVTMGNGYRRRCIGRLNRWK
ncbi:MAG: sporulation transcriptional regulator SpoIIID [Lachnospiraceae bacterium]|nr:sporulation transcriptional regulator SpoIIID [Lachnospiraceae bacterium]